MISVDQISRWTCEVIITTENAVIKQDISTRKDNSKEYEVEWPIIAEFWRAIVSMADFNSMSEVDLMHALYEKSLSKREKEEFNELINSTPDEL